MNPSRPPSLFVRTLTAAAVLAPLIIAPANAPAADAPVSFFKDVYPILKQSCTGCHQPNKLKGKLDLTTFAALSAGGKKGAAVVAGDPDKSRLVTMVRGPEPEMPEDGKPLTAAQVSLIERWVKQGAVDDSPPPIGPKVPDQPPVYAAPPVVVDLQFSPDGTVLAVTGYHEVLLHKPDGSELVGRLVGGSPRLESLVFTTDGKRLAVVGGAPAQYGEVQVWDVAGRKIDKSYRVGHDSLFGASISPDGSELAFGCADKTARMIKIESGEQLLEFSAHTDWVFGTAWTMDGKRLVSGGRDMAMKLIDIETKRFIDDINNPLDTVNKMVRHPKDDQVAYGGKLGSVRLYKISDNQGRTAGRNDTNRVREFERQPGSVLDVAFSADGAQLAVGSLADEARVYNVTNGQRIATLTGHGGAVYSVSFHPDGLSIATGGFDGKVRIFELPSGKLLKEFVPVPIGEAAKAAVK